MGKFAGKIFLELGTNVGSVDIVKYAKSEGAYVIVTDYLPVERSEAKLYADETAMVSTLDVDAVLKLAIDKNIDGVFCGVSEANLLTCKYVADKLNLPFYFTREQWEITQNKKNFKELCEKFNILVPKKYNIGNKMDIALNNAIKFPVIVKPVDLGAAIGISICSNYDELIKAYEYAQSCSPTGNVIVEEYVIGQEISCYYTFINGEVQPSIIIDKYLCDKKMNFTPLPEAYVFPSKFQETYLNSLNNKVINMFKSIGYRNGVACVQCIANENGIYVFECGLRIGGNALYRFVEYVNGNSFMKMLVDYSLIGRIDNTLDKEDCYLKDKHGCILSLLNSGGKIKDIKGYDECKNISGVISSELRYSCGETITMNGTLKQSHIRFFIVKDSLNELIDCIEKINNKIKVIDDKNKDMIYSSFDAKRIL